MLIPGPLISAITFPGVVVHEFAHEIFCKFFKVPVYKVCYFRFGNPAGYVNHGQCNHWYQNVLISAGPFFVNSLIGVLLAFPVVMHSSYSEDLISIDIFLIWLSVSIAMHAIPSRGDAKSMWKAVSGNKAPFLAKIIVSPIIAIIYLLSWGSFFWLDLIYGVCVCFLGPKFLIDLFTYV